MDTVSTFKGQKGQVLDKYTITFSLTETSKRTVSQRDQKNLNLNCEIRVASEEVPA